MSPLSPTRIMPDDALLKDPLEAAAAWREAGLGVALATVVRTWGSAPRQPGSQMCINEHGDFTGSVSGGCVEAAVIEGLDMHITGPSAQCFKE